MKKAAPLFKQEEPAKEEDEPMQDAEVVDEEEEEERLRKKREAILAKLREKKAAAPAPAPAPVADPPAPAAVPEVPPAATNGAAAAAAADSIFGEPVAAAKPAADVIFGDADDTSAAPVAADALDIAGEGVTHDIDDNPDNWQDKEGYFASRVGEVLLNRYQVMSLIGKGVFSTVLRCKDIKEEDRTVAIKVIRRDQANSVRTCGFRGN